eukprot:395040-Rhodomonas_salina.3
MCSFARRFTVLTDCAAVRRTAIEAQLILKVLNQVRPLSVLTRGICCLVLTLTVSRPRVCCAIRAADLAEEGARLACEPRMLTWPWAHVCAWHALRCSEGACGVAGGGVVGRDAAADARGPQQGGPSPHLLALASCPVRPLTQRVQGVRRPEQIIICPDRHEHSQVAHRPARASCTRCAALTWRGVWGQVEFLKQRVREILAPEFDQKGCTFVHRTPLTIRGRPGSTIYACIQVSFAAPRCGVWLLLERAGCPLAPCKDASAQAGAMQCAVLTWGMAEGRTSQCVRRRRASTSAARAPWSSLSTTR